MLDLDNVHCTINQGTYLAINCFIQSGNSKFIIGSLSNYNVILIYEYGVMSLLKLCMKAFDLTREVMMHLFLTDLHYHLHILEIRKKIYFIKL